MAGTDLEKHDSGESHAVAVPHPLTYNPDAPSEEWGWHGQWKLFASRGSRLLLGLFAVVMLLMLFSNHVSNVENWYLIATAAVLFIWIGSREASARKARRLRP